tara:strand:+ start:7034 stop:7912 length:879 start_codon:yes stop_codon:yes gene_type:complete
MIKWLICVLVVFMPLQTFADDVFIEPNVYSQTVTRWLNALPSAEFSFTTWLFQNPSEDARDFKHRNGWRDSVLLVSNESIPEDITVIVWFHGLGGFSDKTFQKRIIPQLNKAASENGSFAIAIPEMPWSVNTQTPRGRQKQVWKKPGSLQHYINAVHARLEKWSIQVHNKKIEKIRWIFVGHSAGGSALTSASRAGDICKLKPELVVWSDASYGSWFDLAWKGCLGKTIIDQHILVRKWDKPYIKIKETFRNRFKKKIPCHLYLEVLDRKSWPHGKIGDNALDLSDVFIIGC